MVYLLGNNIHIHTKTYSIKIRLETYKNLKFENCTKSCKIVFIVVTKIKHLFYYQNCVFCNNINKRGF